MVQHDNRHVWAGLGFIVAALIIGGAIYIGLKPTHEGDASQQAEVEEAEPTEEVVAAPELIAPAEPEQAQVAEEQGGQPSWLVGTWALAETVGFSEGTTIAESCETDNVVNFGADGRYQSGGADIDGGDNSDNEGSWSFNDGVMTYTADNGTEYSSTIEQVAPFAMIETGYRGGEAERLVRCSS